MKLKKLKKVIQGCLSRYTIKEITVICGYRIIYSGDFIQFYTSQCEVSMIKFRNELLEREVEEKTMLHEKLFVFLKHNEE